MLAKYCRIFKVLFVLINAVHFIKCKNSFSEVIKDIFGRSSDCYDPDHKLGTCISIYDCESLKYVVQNEITRHYQFLRNSQCYGGEGRPPFVCCVKDSRVSERRINRRSMNDGRIVFPDQLNDTIKFELTSSKNMESSTTVSNRDDNELINIPKFPKPPHCGGVTVSNKIYSGEDAESTEFLWMVILEFKNLTTGEFVIDCSGSLINEKYVLTVAHCVQGKILRVHGRLESVRIGVHNTDLDPIQRIGIHSVIPHEGFRVRGYEGERDHHDIALIRLARPVHFTSTFQPVCLPTSSPLEPIPEQAELVISGWGHNGTSRRTATKQKLSLPFVNHKTCRNIFTKVFYLTDEQMCAGGIFRQDACSGDSGGPLMRLVKNFWVLEGLVSFGVNCGLEKPGIYTNVRHYIDWIEEKVKP